MKKKLTWLDRMTAAVTFAEANEQDTAQKFLPGSERRQEKKRNCKECGAILTTDMPTAEINS